MCSNLFRVQFILYLLHDSHSSDGDAGIENRVTDKGEEQEGEGEMNGESSMGICCMTQGTQTRALL